MYNITIGIPEHTTESFAELRLRLEALEHEFPWLLHRNETNMLVERVSARIQNVGVMVQVHLGTQVVCEAEGWHEALDIAGRPAGDMWQDYKPEDLDYIAENGLFVRNSSCKWSIEKRRDMEQRRKETKTWVSAVYVEDVSLV